MQSLDLIFHSLRNVRRGLTRSMLAAVAVAIGVFSVVVISAVGNGGQAVILQEIQRLGLQGLTVYTKESSGIQLREEDISVADGTRGVEAAMPVLLEYAAYEASGMGGASVLWGVTEELPQIMNLSLMHGRFFTPGDLAGMNPVLIIDDQMAKKVFDRTNAVGETLSLSVGAGKVQFTVVGVIASQKAGLDQLLGESLPQFLYLPYDTLSDLSGRREFDQLAVCCMADEEPDAVGSAVVQRLNRAAGINAYQYQNISGYQNGLQSVTDLVKILISGIAMISLVVAGLCVMNNMLASAKERKREIGICMAIGAQRGDILRGFLIESAVIAAIGGSLGAGTAILIIKLAEWMLNVALPFSWTALIAAELVSAGIGLLFGFIPAKRAADLDPINALKEE